MSKNRPNPLIIFYLKLNYSSILKGYMAEALIISTGTPSPLGFTPKGAGGNFALYSAHATKVVLGLFIPGASHPDKEFPLNALSWISQGRCDEVQKYSAGATRVCENVKVAKENTRGVFLAKKEELLPDGVYCTYSFVRKEDGVRFSGHRELCADFADGQQVVVNIRLFVSHGLSDEYKYLIEFAPKPE